ncbi:MAG: ABC transporter ATP-binding protein [Betaproteobacteria bacterium]|nr:ABC transporter ATP-binding protein [Betaproteobacteria bacterium]
MTTPLAEPVLRVEELTVAITSGGERALAVDQVSFDVRAGETVCLVGESGSGKSMIAHAVIGLLPKHGIALSKGRIYLGRHEMASLPESGQRELRGTAVGMVFQEPLSALNPIMPVGEQIDEVMRAHTDLDVGARLQRVLALMKDVQLPDPDRTRRAYPFQLSGGQRQRVMIAMALVLAPRLLIADEPTTALDVTTQAQILGLIRELQRTRGIGVLFITHDFGIVNDIADRVLVMQRGCCVEAGPATAVLQRPQHVYTRQLIAAVPELRTSPEAAFRDGEPVRPLLVVRNVSKYFAGRGDRVVRALSDVNLGVAPGETLGVVGESGSGKSTLAKVIVGLLDPDAGTVEFDGRELSRLGRRERRPLRREMQMVFQDPYGSLNPRHRVARILAEGPLAYGEDMSTAMARARELLEHVGLDANALTRFPHQFSGGQRQRISIARALTLRPRLLIADEPVSALDVSVQAQVLDLLRALQRDYALTMIFVTHDLRVASEMCDRIVVMREGRVIEAGEAARICGAPANEYTRTLIDAIPGRGWIRPSAAALDP